MLVITYLLRRRSDLSAEEFHRYWRDEHGPLVARHAPTLGIAWYTQLHTDDSPLGDLIRASRDCADERYDEEELFAQAGVCESVAVISDKYSGQSRGFGFVEMGSNGDAQRAIQQFDGKDFRGRPLKVNEAKERENSGGISKPAASI